MGDRNQASEGSTKPSLSLKFSVKVSVNLIETDISGLSTEESPLPPDWPAGMSVEYFSD